MTKYELLADYINQADSILMNNDVTMAQQYCQCVTGVFCNEIANLEYKLSTTAPEAYTEDRPPDYFADVKILKEKLVNYQVNLQEQAAKVTIEKLSKTQLEESEKAEIKQMILDLIDESKQKKVDKKASSKIFSWLADKGIDTFIQMLPLIVSGAF